MPLRDCIFNYTIGATVFYTFLMTGVFNPLAAARRESHLIMFMLLPYFMKGELDSQQLNVVLEDDISESLNRMKTFSATKYFRTG